MNNVKWNKLNSSLRKEVFTGLLSLAILAAYNQLTINSLAAEDAKPAAGNLVPLDLKLPKLAFIGTPTDFEMNEHIEPPSDKPRPAFMVPPGAENNVALNKKVTLSDKNPTTGEPALVTDGDKEATDTSFVQMHRGLQWAQVDLGEKHAIHAIVVWHAHNAPQVYRDVVVQVSDDPDFVQDVKTVYNNDYDNSSGLGIGTDKEYFESFEGRLIKAKGTVGRYVRLYSKGSTYSALNRYTEVEVFGMPAK
jgi:hypothetical protein